MPADRRAPKVLLADANYDSNFIRENIERRGDDFIILTKQKRLIQLPVDAEIHDLRNMAGF